MKEGVATVGSRIAMLLLKVGDRRVHEQVCGAAVGCWKSRNDVDVCPSGGWVPVRWTSNVQELGRQLCKGKWRRQLQAVGFSRVVESRR